MVKKWKKSFWTYITKLILAVLRLELGAVNLDVDRHIGVFRHQKSERQQLVFFLFPSPANQISTARVGDVPIAIRSMVTRREVTQEHALEDMRELEVDSKTWFPAFLRALFRALPYIYLDGMFRKHELSCYEVNTSVNDEWYPVVWGVARENWQTRNWKMRSCHVCFLYSNDVKKTLNPRPLDLSLMANAHIGVPHLLRAARKLLRSFVIK